jgi:hypothetical protein
MAASPFVSSCQHASPGRGRRVGVTLAVLALLLAQAVGLLHRAWHDTGHAGSVSQAALQDPHRVDPAEGPFRGHPEGGAECRLLDHLAHADALMGAGITAPAGLPSAVHHGERPRSAAGRHRTPYQARAPPGRAGTNPAAAIG